MIRSQFDLLDQVKELKQGDLYCKFIQELIRRGTPSPQKFTEKDGILYFKDILVILDKGNLIFLIMQEAHYPPYAAHLRDTKMREDLK